MKVRVGTSSPASTPSPRPLPLGVVLTLAATGSESNGAAVITQAATRTKAAFMSPLVQPKFAVLDPATLATLPDRQLANGVVDAFVHVCEQYLTVTGEAWVQDGYAEALLRNLVKLAGQWERRRGSVMAGQPDVDGEPGPQWPHRRRRAPRLGDPRAGPRDHRLLPALITPEPWPSSSPRCCGKCCRPRRPNWLKWAARCSGWRHDAGPACRGDDRRA